MKQGMRSVRRGGWAALVVLGVVAVAFVAAAALGAGRVAAPAERAGVVGGPERSTVYLWHTSVAFTTWAQFDRDAAFVDPERPHFGADMRYHFRQLGVKANAMGVDGICFTTPHVPPPVGDPDRWRIRFEGRLDALAQTPIPSVTDRRAIHDGLVELRASFRGRIVLYTGYPDDRDVLLSRDADYCDGYVKSSIGPYMDSGAIDAVIIDSAGDYYARPACRAVLASIARLWPGIPRGGEPHPIWSMEHGFACSLTTRLAANFVFTPWRQPITPAFSPVIIAYSVPRRVDLADALAQVRMGRSVAILAWQVGYTGEPSPADRAAWEGFMAGVRAHRRIAHDGAVVVPPATN